MFSGEFLKIRTAIVSMRSINVKTNQTRCHHFQMSHFCENKFFEDKEKISYHTSYALALYNVALFYDIPAF